MPSVGSIVGGGFRLIMQRPLTVAIWAVVYLVFALATRLLVFQQLGVAADPAAIQSGAVSPFGMMGSMLPLWIVSLIFYSVMMCAAYRAVLRPSDSGFASLRLGMDELRVTGLMVMLAVALIIVVLVVALVFGVVIGGVVAATGGGAVSIILGFVAWLACFCGSIYVWVRLSLIFSLTFHRRRIAVDEAWGLTRGRFWTLFGAYFIIGVITIVASMLVIMPFMSSYFTQLAEAFRDPAAMRALQEQQFRTQAEMPLVTVVITTVISSIFSAIMLALGGGATATATRELLLEEGEVLEDDAEETAAIFE